MITRTAINVVVQHAVEDNESDPIALITAVTDAVMDLLKLNLEGDGLIVTEGGGPHLLDANDKTVWRADSVAGVAAHIDPAGHRAEMMIVRRYGRHA